MSQRSARQLRFHGMRGGLATSAPTHSGLKWTSCFKIKYLSRESTDLDDFFLLNTGNKKYFKGKI